MNCTGNDFSHFLGGVVTYLSTTNVGTDGNNLTCGKLNRISMTNTMRIEEKRT